MQISKKLRIIVGIGIVIQIGVMVFLYLKTSWNKDPETHVKNMPLMHREAAQQVYRSRKLDSSSRPSDDIHCINTLTEEFYGTSDMPLIIPDDSSLQNINEQEIRCLYHRYVTTRQVDCVEIPQLGNRKTKMNGWHICVDDQYTPTPGTCLVLSFDNTATDTQFAVDVVRNFGCKVHRFFPRRTWFPKHTNITDHIGQLMQFPATETTFLRKRLAAWKKDLGVSDDIIDILTIRTRFSDLIDIANSPELYTVRQLALLLAVPIKHTGTGEYRQLLKILNRLAEKNFSIYHFERTCANDCINDVKPNTAYPDCYTVYMINKNLARKHVAPKEVYNMNFYPSEEELLIMTNSELDDTYNRILQSVQYGCREIIRAGNIRDGGWEICHDENIRPRSQDCLVYSFGINYDFTFDDDISRTYGCEVHSFDPSMKNGDHQRSEKVRFYAMGLSDEDEDHGGPKNTWKMQTLETIVKNLYHIDRFIDVLKIDIENSEWKAIPNMIHTGTIFKASQLAIEFHSKGNIDSIIVLKALYDNGFRIFWTSGNQCCQYVHNKGTRSRCVEVYFVNIKFL